MHRLTLGLMHSGLGPVSITLLHYRVLFFHLLMWCTPVTCWQCTCLQSESPSGSKLYLHLCSLMHEPFEVFLLVFKRLERGITSLKPILTLFEYAE